MIKLIKILNNKNNQMTKIQEELKYEYKRIFNNSNNRPTWAAKKKTNANEIIHPTIPFIGKSYNNTKLLLYASAENLTYYYNDKNRDNLILDNDNFAIDRHRENFNQSKEQFYPNVHLQPVDNGSLVVMMFYILKHLNSNLSYNKPIELLEDISCGNFGKFSIDPKTIGKNIDYANDIDKLSYSFEYIEADLKILQPKILIMPCTIYRHLRVQQLITKNVDGCKILRIYQITPTTINLHIKKYSNKQANEIGILYKWHQEINGRIKGKIKENFRSIYTYLDNEVLKK